MPRIQNIWTKEEDKILLCAINQDGRKNWKYIATLLQNKIPIECFYRFRKINPAIKKSKWTVEEDNLLLRLHATHGNNWAKIAKLMKSRGTKQIRDRFINNLDPKIKRGNFTIDEDLKILKLKMIYGNKWSLISKHFPDRSPDIIKSRYYSSVKNKKELLLFLDSLDNVNSSNAQSNQIVNHQNQYSNEDENMMSQINLSINGFQNISFDEYSNGSPGEISILSQQTNNFITTEMSSDINFQCRIDNSSNFNLSDL